MSCYSFDQEKKLEFQKKKILDSIGQYLLQQPPQMAACGMLRTGRLAGSSRFEIPHSLTLCLAFKVGVVTDWNAISQALNNVPADGNPSRITGESFTCRTWTEDGLRALNAAGIIRLDASIADIEKWAVTVAKRHRRNIELGTRPAKVVNEPVYSVDET